ncbi:MAG: hypothetical protein V3V84_07870 [Candidatus Bathyarchaeia archaeon]
MKFLTCRVTIPETDLAKDALNKCLGKILRAHGASEEDYFEIIEEKSEAKKKPGPKPKQATEDNQS